MNEHEKLKKLKKTILLNYSTSDINLRFNTGKRY